MQSPGTMRRRISGNNLGLLWIALAVLSACGRDDNCEDWGVIARCEGNELVEENAMYGADCSNDDYRITSTDRTVCAAHCVEAEEGVALCALEETISPDCGEAGGEYCADDTLITCAMGYVVSRRECDSGCAALNDGKYGMASCEEDR